MFKKLMLFFVISIAFLRAQESEQIVVRLATENQLIPVYLSKFVNDNSGFSPAYIRSLEGVLSFDLNHNGMTYTVPQTADKEKLANALAINPTKQNDWKKFNIYYVVKVQVKGDRKLIALVYSINGSSVKALEGVVLTGDLRKDREAIHSIADAIHRALFDKDGIASTKILYTIKKKGEGGKLSSEIWQMDYDGENKATVLTDAGYAITPTYIPPKKGFKSPGFFFVSYKVAEPKIFIGSFKDKDLRRFISLRGNQLMPTLSRQQDKVAFISDITGNPDLFLQDFHPEKGAVGKPRQIFSAKKASQGSPTFSPDGKKIAFVSNKDGSARIYMMDIPSPGLPLKSIKAELLTKHAKESSAPAWSPDGTKLAYCASINGVRQIWIYDFTTKEERQITQGPGNKENPSWAPNSLSLVYNSGNQDVSDLYLINLNQPKATKITSGPYEKRFPCWEIR